MLKSANLLQKLSELESTLREFSMEELPTYESVCILQSLASFRTELEQMISVPGDGRSAGDCLPVLPDDIVHTISRDLKRPLDDIMGCIDLLKESRLCQKQEQYVDAILAASDILIDINNQLIGSGGSCLNATGKQHIQSKRQNRIMTRPEKYQTVISTHISGQQKKIDLHPVMEDCLGQVELLEELVGLFKINVLEFIGQVKLHLQNGDFKGIAFASHKIKNGLKMLNVSELLTIAEQMDIQSRTDKDIKHLRFLFDCFISEYPDIEKELEAAIKQLKEKQK